jgi:cysteine desulfurase/selenocysteine lyase
MSPKTPPPSPVAEFNVSRVREDFPILHIKPYGKPLVYLDNAASTQKPLAVISALKSFYESDYANVHRGLHYLSERATALYESARETVKQFLNAKSTSEIIFTKSCTEAINLVAASYGRMSLKEGDEVLLTEMEHHSNIVPWQMVCEERSARLVVAPIDERGALIEEELFRLITPKTKIVALAHVSNALGTINPVETIIQKAHEVGARVLIDGAQAVAHLPDIDVQKLNCDFYAFSGHKVYGPTGIGVLYGKGELLETMPPYQGGGEMIRTVFFEKTTYKDPPYKFEAGTPPIAQAIGLKSALEYLNSLSRESVFHHEDHVLKLATELLKEIPHLRVIGTAPRKCSILSFVIEGAHPHDIATVLDHEGIAVRAGHHCAQPVMRHFNVPATTRASFALYNTEEEAHRLLEGIRKACEILL